jgi:hypothetical protein
MQISNRGDDGRLMISRCYPEMTVVSITPTVKSGWWLTYPSEKYEFVSWDDDKSHVPNHQPAIINLMSST